ncbi:DEKNAAC102009 [Brettanomyces naardenensis]|uniref:DEKNAAC102009 n=1 Tax=Brettanomyces naardenensis TaxID=13370 RepID=A0A448YJ88_BRENA|nr:DEKNAAC102009 [Brettanomyces naardenensis]
MTVYIASLFLPYTVHFEVEASKVSRLNADDIVEPVEIDGVGSPSRVGSPSDSDYEESTVSILKSLAINNSTSSLPLEDLDAASISSVGEISQTTQQFSPTSQKQPTTTPSRPSLVSSAHVSVQDFFFNNPNSTRLSLASPSLDETQVLSESGYFGSTSTDKLHRSSSGLQLSGSVGSTGSAYVKPRSRLRNPPPPTTVSELQPRPLLEHSWSTRSLGSSSMGRALLARRSMNPPGSSRQRSPFGSNDTGFEGDGDTSVMMSASEGESSVSSELKPLSGQKADDQLDRYFADKTGSRKVVPFGGFSKDYKALLEDQNNVFATAPWKVVRYERGNGSLRNAVRRATISGDLQDVKWVGTPGMPSDLVPQATRDAISTKLRAEYRSDAIYVDDDVFEGHYDRYCKQVLWPILHYQLPEQQKANAFVRGSWRDYEKVNQQFADRIVERYKRGDVVWVHDYHLMLVPGMVRKKLPAAKIGFFLHVSFPSSEVFRCVAQRNQILEGMLGADCIGMQTDEFVAHFFQSCNRLLLADFDDHGVRYGNRTISVTHNPVGIDAAALHTVLNSDVVNNWRGLVRDRWPQKTLIVSRDKLDRIRGVKEKLLAYERFLKENPEYMEHTLLLLICIPGRAAAGERLENEILTIVERINSRTDNIASDRPVVVLNQDLQFEQYLALLSEAGLFIVSTLHEGMNLTCHEYVEASAEDHSPLILSEFVGSAAVLSSGALLTNPYNIEQVADAIKECIQMSAEERERRWKAMHAAVLRHDSLHWIKEAMDDLNDAYSRNTSQLSGDVRQLTWSDLDYALQKSNFPTREPAGGFSRLFVINLLNITTSVEIQGTTINPVQQRLVDAILNNLTADPSNAVYLLSHSTRSDMGMRCRSFSDVGLLAENGGYVRLCDESDFIPLVKAKELEWMAAVVETMRSWSERIPGSYVEVESCMVRFHTEGSHDIDPDHRDKLVGELMSHINELYGHDWYLHASITQRVLVVQKADTVQRALQYILDQNEKKGQFKFVMAAGGSSSTDEEVYNFFKEQQEQFNNNVLTVKIGKPRQSSGAEFKLQGMNELLIALSRIQ